MPREPTKYKQTRKGKRKREKKGRCENPPLAMLHALYQCTPGGRVVAVTVVVIVIIMMLLVANVVE